MASTRLPAALAAMLACAALPSCGGGEDGGATQSGAPISPDDSAGPVTVVMAYTRSPEQQLLAQIYAQSLEAAGFRVRLARGLGAGGPAVAALVRRRVAAYPRF